MAAHSSAFDFASMDIPCPHCGKDSLQLIRELVENDFIPCKICHAPIDLKDRRALIDEAAKQYKDLRFRKV